MKQTTHEDQQMQQLARWLLVTVVGCLVGLVTYGMFGSIALLYHWKWDLIGLREFHTKDASNQLVMFLSFVLFNVILNFIASFMVVFFEPAASGSGIPEV